LDIFEAHLQPTPPKQGPRQIAGEAICHGPCCGAQQLIRFAHYRCWLQAVRTGAKGGRKAPLRLFDPPTTVKQVDFIIFRSLYLLSFPSTALRLLAFCF